MAYRKRGRWLFVEWRWSACYRIFWKCSATMIGMTEIIILLITLLAAAFVGKDFRNEWKAARRRRDRDELRHLLGARQWWGRR